MISNQPQLSFDEKLNMLQQMQTIRRFEERASEGFLSGDIYGVVHCYIGEEAVAVGVCQALRTDDQIISTHRGHGHCIAKGADRGKEGAQGRRGLGRGRRVGGRAGIRRCANLESRSTRVEESRSPARAEEHRQVLAHGEGRRRLHGRVVRRRRGTMFR